MIVVRVSFKPLIHEDGNNLFILYGSKFKMSFLFYLFILSFYLQCKHLCSVRLCTEITIPFRALNY